MVAGDFVDYKTLNKVTIPNKFPIPRQIWEDVSMDFIEGLPKSAEMDSILVVDRLGKYGHFIALKHPFIAANIVGFFLKEIVRLHGVLNSIVSDRDKKFISHFWEKLFRLQCTQLNRSTSYHPQFDGQMKVLNCTLETYLRCFSSSKPKERCSWLPWVEY